MDIQKNSSTVQQYDNQGRLLLPLMWEGSQGFKNGATKLEIFLNAAARAGYTHEEVTAFWENPTKAPVSPVPPYDTVSGIMAYENGDLDHEGTIELFQALVNNGMAWTLQGSYGRTAKSLIDAGLVNMR
jgi:hypothetical protein